MRQATVTVYQFNELSDKAKERAKSDYAARNGYAWDSDALKSIEKLAEHFGGRMKNYSVDFFASSYSSADFDMPEDMEEAEIAERLAALGDYDPETLRGSGSCRLTGFCADEDAIDGFRKAWHDGERDLDALMQAAFDSWLKAAQADCENQYTDERFAEHAEANGYEYNADGSVFARTPR